MKVVGVDGFADRWITVVLDEGMFYAAAIFPDFEAILREHGSAATIAVDIPIGLPPPYPRPADAAARDFVGPRRNSVFLTPVRKALTASTFPEAVAANKDETGKGLSQQAYALRRKILELDALAPSHAQIIEVHPEVSFRELAGTPLHWPKKTWNGQRHRLGLLAGAGIALPDEIAGVAVPPDDLLDAAVAAWSADRFARDRARPLPEDHRERIGAIWR